MSFTETQLFRRTLAEQPAPDEAAVPRARLRQALFQFRERAKTLAGEIHRDLPDFTVHDITHLDALWEMADLIAGPDYPLTPIEAFALGGAFLLHDLGLGLAAWPGGVAEIKRGPGWKDALSAHLRKHLGRVPTEEELASPPPEVERAAVLERLRGLHAEQAERLALASWGEYHLIEDTDLRRTLGPLLGKIAHSHWWPVSRLGSEFGTVVGALPDCPSGWTIDPLKLAVLLRTADAAHLDTRRAPGFLLALRRPEGIAEEHWAFQERLLKPRLEEDRLVYTTARPFSVEVADAWWLCQGALRIVDGELHQVDALLADLHRPRLRARGVAGVESTRRLQDYVRVSGWTPVDARVHVSNVADIVRRLGGEQLYGDDPTVPLRELIQNASDAVRARRILEDRSSDWGTVTVRLGRDDQGPWIEVEDTGIGMSEAVLSEPLLDFGTTYWGSALMREEHEGLWAKGFEPTGRFGIGFFSVFMWGQRVRVTTRPYLEAQRDTRVLEFQTGLDVRPVVRPARREEQLQEGGTRVRVWLNNEPAEEGGLLHPLHGREAEDFGFLCEWLAPALDVDLYVEDEKGTRRVVAASDWLTIDGDKLFDRISLHDREWRKAVRAFSPFFRVLRGPDGQALGRAVILDDELFWIGPTQSRLGTFTIGGLRAKNALHGFAGILVGFSGRAARDWAYPAASPAILAAWASEQALLLHDNIRDTNLLLTCAAAVAVYGGNPGSLPIAMRGKELIDCETLGKWTDAPSEVLLRQYRPRHYGLEEDEDVVTYPNVLSTYELGSILPWASSSLGEWIKVSLAMAWGCSPQKILAKRLYERCEIGMKGDIPVMELVTMIFKKPEPAE